MYQLTTIEEDRDNDMVVLSRSWHSNLASLVRLADRQGWVPGNISGTGMTIKEVHFEGEPPRRGLP